MQVHWSSSKLSIGSLRTGRPFRGLLMRGESAVASMGIVLAAILLAAMAGSGWWTLQTQRQTQGQARQEQAQAIGGVMAQSAEVMLGNDELTAVRRLVADAARDHHLKLCRIILSNGLVVADAESSRISAKEVPANWADRPHAQGQLDVASLPDVMTFPIIVRGRGNARLELQTVVSDAWWLYWKTQTGVGLIGAATLVALLCVYRRMRSRLSAMSAIREALLALGNGERMSAALMVNGELGPEALAWNRILEEKDKQQHQTVEERAKESLGTRRSGRTDLDAAFDAMSHGLILVDEKIRAKYANGAAATYLKTDRETLLGVDLSTLITDPGVYESVRNVANGTTRRRSTIEIEQHGEGGVGVLRFNIRPVRKEDSASAMIIIEDVTQQRVAEEARNTFVAQATHELRTPLTNIRLYVETAIEEGDKNPSIRTNALNIINQESRRLERIVGEMLSVAEIEAGSFKLRSADIYLDLLLEELKADFEQQAKDKKMTLLFNLPPKLPVVHGDRDKIVVALHNLVGNALKYTPEGGQVTVSAVVDRGQLSIDVNDTGIGISEEEAEQIFEKFYRSKDPRVGKITGTGLGLTLAREVVRLHGGDITVRSEVNKGSTFTITLPLGVEAAEAAAA